MSILLFHESGTCVQLMLSSLAYPFPYFQSYPSTKPSLASLLWEAFPFLWPPQHFLHTSIVAPYLFHSLNSILILCTKFHVHGSFYDLHLPEGAWILFRR